MQPYAPFRRCPQCGYLREAAPCPECGSYAAPVDPRPRERRWRILRRCALIALTAICLVALVVLSLAGGRGYRIAPPTVLAALQHAGYPSAASELLRRYHAGKLSPDCFARMYDAFAVDPRLEVPERYMTETEVPVDWSFATFSIPGGLARNGWRVQLDRRRILVDDQVVREDGAWPGSTIGTDQPRGASRTHPTAAPA